ncbi:MAG: energy transducer TonB [Flavobacteriales bacterium]|nr:energy transducer TonB [Flavobacteriales bacterium]
MLQVNHALFACLLASVTSQARAQVVTAPYLDDGELTDSVFTVVEVSPAFTGGEAELYKYLLTAIRYPDAARDAGIQGTVFINFVVEKDGRITNANVLRGIGGGCDEVALNAVRSMPAWTPGEHKGQRVRVRYNLPVKFTMKEPEKVISTSDRAYTVVEEMPEFPGGAVAMYQFIKKELRYPTELKRSKANGTVHTTFEIGTDGSINNARVYRGFHPAADAEALRLVNSMPAWSPGKQRGKPVRVQFTLPIRFSPK